MLGLVAPLMEVPVGGRSHIVPAVETVTGQHGLGGLARGPRGQALDMIGAALTEVLRCIDGLCAPEDTGATLVELWVESSLVIVAVRFPGRPMPEWLMRNWDRGSVPVRLAPGGAAGNGWLIVREGFDSALQQRTREGNLLLLERRL